MQAMTLGFRSLLGATVIMLGAVVSQGRPPVEEPKPEAGVILDEGCEWRISPSYQTPIRRAADGLEAPSVFATGSIPTPAGWEQPDFDDGSWARYNISRAHTPAVDYGFWVACRFSASLSRQCLRGRFLVKDPATVRDLKLSLVYRGGAVVYLNGKEIARGNLARGVASGGSTLAEEYPPEAFFKTNSNPIFLYRDFNPKDDRNGLKAQLEKRLRRLNDIVIPAQALRQGVNVLAVETIRTAYLGKGLEKEDSINSQWSVWATCGLVSLKLSAAGGVVPNTESPKGFQVWALDRNDRVTGAEYNDPLEPVRPVVLVGARNAFVSGQVVARAPGPLRGLKVGMGSWRGPAPLPSDIARVRYARMGDRWPDALDDAAPAELAPDASGAAWQQILLTVRVPKDAAPGKYSATLAVSATGIPAVEIPVELEVAAWTVPAPAQFRTFLSAYQSPTTLAMHYKVPEWSPAHWKYVERSLALLGELGNKAVQIPIVERTQYGNDEGMLRWIRKADGGYDYDFSIFDRYLALATQYCGKLDYVVFPLWHSGDAAGWGVRSNTQENTVTVIPARADGSPGLLTGPFEHMQVPEFATPASKKFWTPVLLALKARLAKQGMEKAFCLGTISDSIGCPETFKMFDEIIPNVGWHRGCHSMNPKNVPYPLFGKPGFGQVIYHEHCYGTPLDDPRKPFPAVHTLRGNPGTAYFRRNFDYFSPMCFRLTPERSLFTGKQGAGRMGLDFWPVGKFAKGRGMDNLFNRWPQSTCMQREPTVFRLTSPGPEGAVPNLRFEALREGMQEAEALIQISEAADKDAARLGPELTGRIHTLILDRLCACKNWEDWEISDGGHGLMMHTGWQDLNRRLYATAAEVAAKLGPRG